ncbi:MAG: DUF3307 domain-containing protein [Porphyromonas sp.]|nr:DUF3307 domain-containing protein [Porphyromonas sp.]
MSWDILLKLLLAHLLADFALQPKKICEGKRAPGAGKWSYLLLHSFIHAVVVYLLLQDWSGWLVPAIIFVSHLGIDYFKSTCMRENATSFLIDQALHVIVLMLIWGFLFGGTDIFSEWLGEYEMPSGFWIVAIAYVLVLKPTSLVLSMFFKRWNKGTEEMSLQKEDESLPKAGEWIGYLERVLILTFIFTGHIEGVGFLLAAKSVFRFGDLSKAKDIKITEYVLIGTLGSFTIAIIVGFISLAII